MTRNEIASHIWSIFLKAYPRTRGASRRIWAKLYDICEMRYSGIPVVINIHGVKTHLNYGHAYPLLARRFKDWNNPLIEIVYQTQLSRGCPINVVDVGAGVGDTVRLIEANCPGLVDHYHCIEGDIEFFGYLAANLSASQKAILYNNMLSSEEGEISSLVRHHSGSSTAQGQAKVNCDTLDSLLANRSSSVDVIKIDVDGLDGQVLAGAKAIIAIDRPAIIFEWHPKLCTQAGYSWAEHFETLTRLKFTRFVFFDKYGCFSHFMTSLDNPALEKLAEVCLNERRDIDWHYDVIALHESSDISDVALAELGHAKRRRSWY